MICPVCKKDALIVEYKNIELDYCPACHGVWFDSGELEMLLEAAGLESNGRFLENVVHFPEVDVSEKKHRCPICLHKMKKVHIDEDKKIVTDVCNGGHGIWFDGGEVNSLIQSLAGKNSGKAETGKVLSFIGEMFKYQV
jgi:Zn-finger nucleic acid-binding protein